MRNHKQILNFSPTKIRLIIRLQKMETNKFSILTNFEETYTISK